MEAMTFWRVACLSCSGTQFKASTVLTAGVAKSETWALGEVQKKKKKCLVMKCCWELRRSLAFGITGQRKRQRMKDCSQKKKLEAKVVKRSEEPQLVRTLERELRSDSAVVDRPVVVEAVPGAEGLATQVALHLPDGEVPVPDVCVQSFPVEQQAAELAHDAAATQLPSICGGCADLLWRSRLVRHQSGVLEALGLNPGGGVMVKTTRLLEPGSIPGGVVSGFLHMGIMLDEATSWWVFSRFSHFPHPCIPMLLHTYLTSHSLAIKSLMILWQNRHGKSAGGMCLSWICVERPWLLNISPQYLHSVYLRLVFGLGSGHAQKYNGSASSGMIPTCKNLGVTQPGIETRFRLDGRRHVLVLDVRGKTIAVEHLATVVALFVLALLLESMFYWTREQQKNPNVTSAYVNPVGGHDRSMRCLYLDSLSRRASEIRHCHVHTTTVVH
ncbi:hypothetical protein PR048_032484 [Dryococelus australis]|uniref:Uncharacterized protein n=1 Tax=Dryococelus australis TaxID=614101 RepID=A0ABQ9G6F4_9NEOP|nr:hypothetical protein PR048_032484 [Dryococelus australis]